MERFQVDGLLRIKDTRYDVVSGVERTHDGDRPPLSNRIVDSHTYTMEIAALLHPSPAPTPGGVTP